MADRVPTHRPTLEEVQAGTPLSTAELMLLDCAKAGEVATYGPTRPETGTDENTLRAGLIRFLLLGGNAVHPVHPIGVQARGAVIAGTLDFQRCETNLDLYLENCRFEITPNLRDAHLGALFLPGCAVPGIDLHRLRTEGDVYLRTGFRSQGTVDLGSARIGGSLDFNEAILSGTKAPPEEGRVVTDRALNGNSMTVGASVFLSNGLTVYGQVNLGRASIAGQLDCSGGHFDGVKLIAADGAEEVGHALYADAMTVGSDVFLRHCFSARGQVNLRGVGITGQLNCKGGRFDGLAMRAADGSEVVVPALYGDAMTVGANVLLHNGFSARGQVNLKGASISGQLNCEAGSFDGTTRREADGSGTVDTALYGDAMTVKADVFLRKGFTARGQVNLRGAGIAGQLDCSGGHFDGVTQRGPKQELLSRGFALQAQEMKVGLTFAWVKVGGENLAVDLIEAEIGTLADDAASWQKVDPLALEGFRYRSLHRGMTNSERLDWLGRAAQRTLAAGDWFNRKPAVDFDPQPYTQLASILTARGERRGAARVLFERERRLARAEFHRAVREPRPLLKRLWAIFVAVCFKMIAYFYRTMFGYGHFPARALVWALCIWGATALFARATYDA